MDRSRGKGALITGPRAQEKTEENRSLQLLGQQSSVDRKKKDAHSASCIRGRSFAREKSIKIHLKCSKPWAGIAINDG